MAWQPSQSSARSSPVGRPADRYHRPVTIPGPTREEALAQDAGDPLAPWRSRFLLPDGVIYLDGNSLGARPVGVAERVASTIADEWGDHLIAAWTRDRWIELPRRVGDRIGGLIGAAPGQVVVTDSTSVNLFKLLHAALDLRPGRTTILTEAENFPTDRYLIDAVAASRGLTVRVVPADGIDDALTDDVALLCLTHVNYRSGRRHDLARITAAAQTAGALTLWDLAHSAGAMPLTLDDSGVDFAVGCSYKFLNGGPGAPAFAYVAARHRSHVRQPIPGWLGHADPFSMRDDYEPADGIGRMITGTAPVLSLVALDAALDAFDGVDLVAVRAKSEGLAELFVQLVETRCGDAGLTLASPRRPGERGSQVSFAHDDGYGIVQALIERSVVGDYREPSICRFGLAPLYLRYVDVWDAADRLVDVLASGAHLDARFAVRGAVT